MKNYKNKNKYLFSAVLISIFSAISFSACDSYGEEPPLRDHVATQTDYNMPVGVPMSDEEREIVSERNKEYKTALGINN